MTDLRLDALDWHAHGFSPLPVMPNGSKRPAVNWQPFIIDPPTLAEVETYFTKIDTDGIGLLCGAASGQLEMFEVEGRAAHLAEQLRDLMIEHGMRELWEKIDGGYVERSPSGGLHWLYRVDGQSRGNTKLARDRQGNVTIETRGEGGFTVIAPSAGRTHSSGVAWTVVTGTIDTIPTITADERDELHALATRLDDTPDPVATTLWPKPSSSDATGSRPGDDFNARADWLDILGPHGWQPGRPFTSGGMRWTRPGKDPRDGISATTGTSADDADRLYVFSSSTTFDTERPYSKFSAYAHLEHGGDYAAAARQLGHDGYGQPTEQARPALTLIQTAQPTNAAPTRMRTGNAPSSAVPAENPTPDVTADAHSDTQPSTYTSTDDGNALRLIDAHGAELRYCAGWGTWLTWNGHRWLRDIDGHVDELARSIARGLPDSEKAHRKASLSARGLAAMVKVARTDPRIRVSVGDLDARAYELNTPAGVVDLRTGEIRTPDAAALHTRSTPISPDFTKTPVRWLQFLADTFAGDPALTEYVHRLIGLSIIGEVREAILPFLWGKGANGKSTCANVFRHTLGSSEIGYALSAPAELLLAATFRSHPTEIARLSGARLVIATELEDGERFAEAKIKLLTGNDELVARFMGKDFFSFRPTHTFMLLANDQPTVRAGGPAFWRRLRLLPFLHVVPKHEQIKGLDDALIASEGPAILAWIIRGCMAYLNDGLAEPASVRAATDRYEAEQDHLARFVDECCTLGDSNALHMHVAVAKLRAAYETFCRVEGETPLSPRGLTMQLQNRFGVETTRTNQARFYAGIRVDDTALSVTPVTLSGRE